MESVLLRKINYLKGVGDYRAELLDKELGICTYEDLLYYLPFRYIDRTRVYRIEELRGDEESHVQFRGRITHISHIGEGRKQRLRVVVDDGSGAIELLWFKGIKWIEKRLEAGREYLIFGKVAIFNNYLSSIHPEVETIEKVLSRPQHSKLQGVYSTTERLNTSMGTKWFHNLITTLWSKIEGEEIPDLIPEYVRQHYKLLPIREALYNVHFPQSKELLAAAQLRLKFEDFLPHQLYLQQIRASRHARLNGFIFNKVGDYFNRFYTEKLPFPLTGAQKRVVKEIRNDTTSGYQMNRLLQGDVGSGKTVVALATMLLAVDNGYQAAIMAPTEILARQHYASIQRMVDGIGVNVAILTGSSNSQERREALEGAASGGIDILIGTHALIEDGVQFKQLGLAIIDEQHRFGVEQRAKLWNKTGLKPHILVMTATPIPRTLAMTLYGDLDVSIIDELPPGRKPIVTSHRTYSHKLRIIGFMREQIALGRQVYVVYPLISESEAMDYMNLTEGYEELGRHFPMPEYQIAICHGQMKAADKDEQMRRFKSGEAHIMVATTVIEVGVDVPNATVMVIESAERFGLAQLHQLRGRVGRGGEQSYCILLSNEKLSSDSRKRLEVMVETTDGFRLSELDLRLRGGGDINGTQQSGEAITLRVANPTRDVEILSLARNAAESIASVDKELKEEINQPLNELVERVKKGREIDFSTIS